MMRMPIKYLLPLLLLIFSTIATVAIYVVDRDALISNLEQRMVGEVQARLTSIQRTLELLLELNEMGGIASQFAAFSALPDNTTLLLSDVHGEIVASNSLAELGQPLQQLHPEIDQGVAARVVLSRRVQTVMDGAGNWIDAYAAVCIRSGESLRRDACGLLYHRLNLSYHREQALGPLWVQIRSTAIALTVASLLLGYLIHLLLFRRTEILAERVGRFAMGERSVRSGISGHDEVACLAMGIDSMMDQIERDEQELQAKEQRLETLFDSVLDPIVVTTLDGRIRSFNKAAEALFGYHNEAIIGENINILMPSRDRGMHDRHMGNYQSGVQASTVIGKGRELIALNRQGEEFPVLVTITEMRNGESTELIGVIRDISERKRAEEQMRLARQVFETTSEAIIITDADSVVVDVNPAYERITGYSYEEMVGRKPSKVSSQHHDEAFYHSMWQQLREDGCWAGEIWDRRKSGEPFPKWLAINAIYTADRKVSHYIGIFSDITEQKVAKEQLERLAYYDQLTKLPNRALYRDRLERELLQVKRSGRRSALLFVDLDRFKPVNDSLGHDVGDDLLIEVAERLRYCVRSSDTVSRLGGDEFTVLLSDVTEKEGIERVAQNIIELLRQPFMLHGNHIEIGASIGIALIPEDADTYIEINKKADIAMYHAKSQGRGNYQYYDDSMKQE